MSELGEDPSLDEAQVDSSDVVQVHVLIPSVVGVIAHPETANRRLDVSGQE